MINKCVLHVYVYLMITQLFSVLKSFPTSITEEWTFISMDSAMQIHQFAVTINEA
jgi:hypothetical protein